MSPMAQILGGELEPLWSHEVGVTAGLILVSLIHRQLFDNDDDDDD